MALAQLKKFVESLPDANDDVRTMLLLSRPKPVDKKRIQSLVRRGYLGCLPFASTGPDDLVLRLLPHLAPTRASVAIAFHSIGEGLTIAPTLQHFVAGRLAHLDFCSNGAAAPDAARRDTLKYASELGGEKSARAVMEACTDALQSLSTTPERMGSLWAAAKDFDPLFAVLECAWKFQNEESPRCVESLRGEARSHPIVSRIRVSYHTRNHTGEDVTEEAWQVAFGDHVFDLSYTGLTRGAMLGSRKINALRFAVQCLRERASNDERFRSPVWMGAQAAVDDPKYDGGAHLRAADELKTSDPHAAYTQLANAAYHAARGKRTLVPKIIAAARALADEQEWPELREILSVTS